MKYLLVIEPAEGSFSAYLPDVPGCTTHGDTLEEVRSNALEALEFHLEEDVDIPAARSLRDILDSDELNGVTVEDFTWVDYEHGKALATA